MFYDVGNLPRAWLRHFRGETGLLVWHPNAYATLGSLVALRFPFALAYHHVLRVTIHIPR